MNNEKEKPLKKPVASKVDTTRTVTKAVSLKLSTNRRAKSSSRVSYVPKPSPKKTPFRARAMPNFNKKSEPVVVKKKAEE